jgi:hypothetical protein
MSVARTMHAPRLTPFPIATSDRPNETPARKKVVTKKKKRTVFDSRKQD